jgi:hypothetical protein
VNIFLQEVYSPIAIHITSQDTWLLTSACRTAFSLGSVRKRGVGWFGSRCRDSILWTQNWERTRLECTLDQHGIMAALFRCALVQKVDHIVDNHHKVEYFS